MVNNMDKLTDPLTRTNDEAHKPATKQTSPNFGFTKSDIGPLIQKTRERTLDFLGNASNETLGACLVGLGAATYIVLGRVGLVLIGVVGGVALHASWDSSHAEADSETKKKLKLDRQKETGIEVALRVLEWRQKRSTDIVDVVGKDVLDANLSTNFSSFRPETAQALETFTNSIVRDYIKWWYSPIVPTDVTFPNACRQVLTKLIVSFSSNLSRKRPGDTLLNFVTNSSSIVIVFLTELSTALSATPNAPAPEAVKTYLEAKPQSSLANLMDDTQQQRKLHAVAEDILERYIDGTVWRCHPGRFFLREILACVILDNTVKSCSRSEWINDWIIFALEEGEPEIMNVIDDSIEDSAVQEAVEHPEQFVITEDGIVIRPDRTQENEAPSEKDTNNRLAVDEEAWKRSRQSSEDDTSDDSRGIQTPSSSHDGVATDATLSPTSASIFTSFDQLSSSQTAKALPQNTLDAKSTVGDVVSIHKAAISIFDDSDPADKKPWKSKPTGDYLIQVEPRSSRFPGWMIGRTYDNFESLHEVLRRIAVISGVSFASSHPTLPSWKGLTKEQLRGELERYLMDAVSYEALAESDGMWKFVDKERSMASMSPSGNKPGFWPNTAALENVGKGVLGTLSKAPKGIVGSGRAMIGGVSNVLGGSSESRKSVASPSPLGRSSITANPDFARQPAPVPPMSPPTGSPRSSTSSMRLGQKPRNSSLEFAMDGSASFQGDGAAGSATDSNSARPSMNLRQESSDSPDEYDDYLSPALSPWPTTPVNERELVHDHDSDSEHEHEQEHEHEMEQTSHMSIDGLSLDIPTYSPRITSPLGTPSTLPSTPNNQRSGSPVLSFQRPTIPMTPPNHPTTVATTTTTTNTTNPPVTTTTNSSTTTIPPTPQRPPPRTYTPLTEQETQITIELLFATITSLYTLSSAWQFRLTLLTAAKSFLLRPGNPQLTSIRTLLQTSVLDAYTTDAGIAALLHKVRANALPTEEELKGWPKPVGEAVKEERRVKARRLLVEKGMPQALTSVMGAAASGEALGKVFDSLQVEEVARGLVFGLVLQALRAVVQ